jgi:hypothetical protein
MRLNPIQIPTSIPLSNLNNTPPPPIFGVDPNTPPPNLWCRPKIRRDGQIRTDDILLPKQALYQAELRPVTRAQSSIFARRKQGFTTAICNYLRWVHSVDS